MNSLRYDAKAKHYTLVTLLAVIMAAACGCGHKTQLRPPEPRRIETVIAPAAYVACDRIILEWAPVMFDTKGDPLTEPASYLVLRKRGDPLKWDAEETPSTSKPSQDSIPSPVSDSAIEPTPPPSSAPTSEPASEPLSEPTFEPLSEPTSEPASEPVSEPTSEPASEPALEPTSEPASEPASEPLTEPASEPLTEPASEPVSEPTSEPASEPALEPGSESESQKNVELFSEVTSQSTPGSNPLFDQALLPADTSTPDLVTQPMAKIPAKEILPTEYDFSLVAIVPGPMVTPGALDSENSKVSWEDTGVAPGPPFPVNTVRFRIPAGFPPKLDPEAEGLAVGYSYTYAVVACDARGVTSQMSKPVRTSCIRIPAAPAILSVVTEPGKVNIQWTRPSTACNGDPLERLDGYYIQRASAEAPDKFVTVKTIKPAGQLTAYDDTVAPDQIYSYRVRGFIEPSIPGKFSAPVTADTTDRFPPEPSAHLSGAVQPSGIHLNWRPVSDPDLAGYRVYRKSGEDRDFVLLNPGSLIRTNTFIDTTVLPGSSYSYRITSVDGFAAANESKPCDIWAATIP